MNAIPTYQLECLKTENIPATNFDLWTKVGKWNEDRIDWFYQDNDYGMPITWLIKSANSKDSLGCASVFRRNFIVNGQSVPGGVNCDFLIHPMHRTLGPAVQLLRKLVSEYKKFGIRFLMAYPSKPALPAFKRCGFKEIGGIRRWSKVLLTRKYFESYHGNKKFLTKISPIVDFFLSISSYDVWNRVFKVRKITFRNTKIESVMDLPESKIVPSGCIGQRSAQYIRWRYSIPRLHKYEICMIVFNEKICGYICCYVDDNMLYVEDLYIYSRTVKSVDVVSAIVGMARSKKVTSINFGFLGGVHNKDILKKMGFRKREKRSVLIHTYDKSLFEELKDQQNWSLMEGDVDL